MAHALPARLAEVLAGYRRRLEARFGPRLVLLRLFGSCARGTAGPDSDVDVAVVVAGLTRDEWRDAVGDACDAEGDSGIALSPFVLSAERFRELEARERRIARDIVNEGRAL
ncbi:MAG: nucleotidyltransferase domain-containing protein [Myxococcales bacterium]|nr:nucleotidyltransferase domain-containing protein [Myxococcales bacterium]